MRGRLSKVQMNELSVQFELQADCVATICARLSQGGKIGYKAGDIEDGLNAAAQIGDDTLQRKSQGAVVPERFTYGSSQQRMAWFKRGLGSGSVQQCDTVAAQRL